MVSQIERERSSGGKKRRLPADIWVFLVGYGVLLPLFLAPLFVPQLLPGRDWPRHLSLLSLLGRPDAAGLPLGAIYESDLRLAPHTLVYHALLFLSQLLSPVNAHRVVLALYVAALPLSLARLLSACARSRLPALLAFPLAYNLSFHLGALSFVCGVPLLLLLLAQAADNTNDEHDAEEDMRPALLRDAALNVLAALLFLCHLELYLLGLLLCAIFILWSEAPMVYRIRAGLCFLPSLVMAGWWQAAEYALHAAGDAGARGGVGGLRGLADAVLRQRQHELAQGGVGLLSDLSARMESLPQLAMLGFADNLHELAAVLCVGALLLYMLGGALSIFIRRGERAMARLGGAGIACLLLVLSLYLLLPERLPQLGASLVYGRYAALLGLLLPLLVPSWLLRMPRWALLLWLIPAVSVGGWYGMELSRHYYKYDAELADFASVLRRTPAGGKAVGLVYAPHSRVLAVPGALLALPTYYGLGAGSLVALTPCELPYMPCRPRDASALPPAPALATPERFNLDQGVPYFDYFFTHAAPSPGRLFGKYAAQVEPLAQAGLWVVYRKKAAIPEPPPSGPNLDAADLTRRSSGGTARPPRVRRHSR